MKELNYNIKFIDKKRYLLAKKSSTKTILFLYTKYGWDKALNNKIKDYEAFFYIFGSIDPKCFDFIVPLTIEAEEYIATHRNLFPKKSYSIPSKFCINTCNNKRKFYNYLAKNGFVEYFPKINSNFDYPYLLRKEIGVNGKNIYIIENQNMEMAYKAKFASKNYFTQEYIHGQDEYTAHIISTNNKIIFFKVLKFTFQEKYFIKGKKYCFNSKKEINHNEYKPIFEDILSTMNYEGICCFNYKVINKSIKIFEINPRPGRTLKYFINEALASYVDSIVEY
ncbi:ATP-grasp domain-containing protein [Sulfurovum sp. NBC37-1]|uniref:ATP-grasp domain-containing protein n=1 Tax=Sulfurovum sp. (strain NBC37-1) TaxID=387093 RepID=UPI0001587D97|nr:ATP-grasp domain-containing protein [Sulfurovum sp. NBC37-1]BAF72337.1 hypothetical protein SUN_1385 [Sulfurovum sp. NBC37-1]